MVNDDADIFSHLGSVGKSFAHERSIVVITWIRTDNNDNPTKKFDNLLESKTARGESRGLTPSILSWRAIIICTHARLVSAHVVCFLPEYNLHARHNIGRIAHSREKAGQSLEQV